MSSNIRIAKTCEFCKTEFIARKTTSKTCSDACAKRLYKLKQRGEKIQSVQLQEEARRKPNRFTSEGEILAIQAKENLNLREAAFLLNVSPLTLRRWTLSGKVASQKVGKKHVFLQLHIKSLVQATTISFSGS
ncbi:MerR family transcriptional regulator [Flaviaesturariibacter terrae]